MKVFKLNKFIPFYLINSITLRAHHNYHHILTYKYINNYFSVFL